jgi:DNA-binding transcriptional regulator YiaG
MKEHERLKEAMHSTTCAALAQMLMVTRRTVTYWREGKVRPPKAKRQWLNSHFKSNIYDD